LQQPKNIRNFISEITGPLTLKMRL